ncbi:MAG: ABC transporter permease subunit [Ktedonobacteraceae bacterium]|nr:ABC transporter permease subunit [Ktedonobacteraceae bacterium]
MNSISRSAAESGMPASPRRDSVVMGSQNYASVVLRLIGVELYKIRRRAMSKALSIVALVIIIVAFCIISIGSLFVLTSPPATFLPPPCTASTPQGVQCSNQSPTQAELNRGKQNELTNISAPLRLPDSLTITTGIMSTIGLVLIVILTGTIVGGEYGVGTIRLMFTRGPTRTQFFLAKIGAVLTCIILGIIIIVPLGILTGALLNLITGIGIDFSFFTGSWFLHSLLKLLITILGLFMFAMIALCFSTLGKATAAGIAGALVWWGLETVLGVLLLVIGNTTTGPLADVAKTIPNYFIGNSINALSQNQSHYISANAQSGAVPDWQALVVLAIYLVIFIGIAWWVNQKRDVTN